MKLLPIKKLEYVFGILSIVNIFIQYIYNINYVTYIIFLFILLETYFNKMDSQEFLLFSFFIPNKYLQIISIPIYLFMKRDLFKPQLTRKAILFLGGITAFGLINCAIYKGLLIQTLLQVGFYYCILLLVQEFWSNDSVKTRVRFFDYIFVLQIVCALLEILITGGIKDNIRGTFKSAHYFGIYLLIYLYMQYKIDNKNKKHSETILLCVVDVVFFILADAKHVLVVILLAFLLVVILNKLHIQRQITIVGVILLIGGCGGLIFSQSNVGKAVIEKSYIRPYLYDQRYNKKYEYMINTYENMKSINGLVGFGVGQYGSQISLTMSKGIIYEWNPDLTASVPVASELPVRSAL